ncbi:MAG TPA: peptidoglycan DD-metalloendopeptidase family protein, partial [Candidatus Paceibacterota bacterium]|nr:peptidoglycan DD-metalloendopeptidase family protein [Candidatus Paceibacterota bacterium]
APEGAPIISPTEAVVLRTGSGEGSGKYVTTANPGGETFTYMHLSEISVKAGEELDRGDLVGLVGNTGNASGGAAHLHFEIRENRKPFDPFERITLELPLKEKINYLEGVLQDADDEDEMADFIVANYKSELWQAKVAGIKLPFDIDKKLPLVGATTPVAPILPVGELTVGSTGPLVSLIQNFLILKDLGPAARALKAAGATGYFGSVTKNAVIEYQKEYGIKPADGYFGSKTLMHLLTNQ